MQIRFQTMFWTIQLGPRTLTGLNTSRTTRVISKLQSLQT